MKRLPEQLFELLAIHSPSYKELEVREYVISELKKTLDSVEVDDKGNVYGVIRMGLEDYTVLLSAHMDTMAQVPPIPTWRKKRAEIHTRSASALGGDDKCGVAAHLAVVRNLKDSTFTGTVKVLFSVAEEVGCVGADEAMDSQRDWFKDVKAAIVIDRRGGTDIVAGMGLGNTFCSKEYGEFWEKMSKATGFIAKITTGTISDTMVFAAEGINSVNLSAGYYHPHSRDEYIVIDEVVRTAKWVLIALDHIQGQTFPDFNYKGDTWLEDEDDRYLETFIL